MMKLSKKCWSSDGALTNPVKGAFFSLTSMFQAKLLLQLETTLCTYQQWE
jgi:hypothetical protein